MKHVTLKIIQGSVLAVMILISGCGFMGITDSNPAPKAEQFMSEELPNGQSKEVKAISVEEDTFDWLGKKQFELKLLIAERLQLEGNEVLVMLAPMPELTEEGLSNLSCSVVLNTESTYEDNIMNEVIEAIMNTLIEDSVNMKVSKENIIIVNGNGIELN